MIAYASMTGTKRNLAALRGAGWRVMISPKAMTNPQDFRYAMDNGAWWAFQNNQPFDVAAFERVLAFRGADADWIVIPDIVMGGMESLALSRRWLRNLRRRKALRGAKFMLAVQNGMEPHHVKRLIGPRVGIFVGGDTEWKLATMRQWASLAHDRGAICHVGRVNTAKRIRLCEAAGVDSFDGSSASRFAVSLPPLEMARRQTDIEGYLERGRAA